jgi:hypothetical protein
MRSFRPSSIPKDGDHRNQEILGRHEEYLRELQYAMRKIGLGETPDGSGRTIYPHPSTIDHGSLSGLVPNTNIATTDYNDDHSQYLMIHGRSGGQTAYLARGASSGGGTIAVGDGEVMTKEANFASATGTGMLVESAGTIGQTWIMAVIVSGNNNNLGAGGETNFVTSLTDPVGNTWTKLYEYSLRGAGGVRNEIASLWYSNIVAQYNTVDDKIIVNCSVTQDWVYLIGQAFTGITTPTISGTTQKDSQDSGSGDWTHLTHSDSDSGLSTLYMMVGASWKATSSAPYMTETSGWTAGAADWSQVTGGDPSGGRMEFKIGDGGSSEESGPTEPSLQYRCSFLVALNGGVVPDSSYLYASSAVDEAFIKWTGSLLTLDASGGITLKDSVAITGATDITGNLSVSGTTDLNGAVQSRTITVDDDVTVNLSVEINDDGTINWTHPTDGTLWTYTGVSGSHAASMSFSASTGLAFGTDSAKGLILKAGGAARIAIDNATGNTSFLGNDIVMVDGSVTGVDTITFTDVLGTIAGIENQNLVDKTATETITGAWSFTNPSFDHPAHDFSNGTFEESFDATVTSNGTTITMSLAASSGSGDLTMRFSTGEFSLDTDPTPATIALTAGTDQAAQKNYIYVPISTKVLTKSTSGWPAGEHIKVAYFYVPSATFVQANGCYANQNWNDHDTSNSDNMGHLAHIGQRVREGGFGARYFSGLSGAGTSDYLTLAGTTVDLKVSAGVAYQMHKQTIPAFDTSAGDVVLVTNWSGDAYHDITNLYDIVADSTGTTITNNRWFNIFVWGAANKSGEYTPIFINLPDGFYVTQELAELDADAHDNFTIPREFLLDSSVAYPICRITVQKQSTQWVYGSTKDLRGTLVSAVTGSDNVPAHTHPWSNIIGFPVMDTTTFTITQDSTLGGDRYNGLLNLGGNSGDFVGSLKYDYSNGSLEFYNSWDDNSADFIWYRSASTELMRLGGDGRLDLSGSIFLVDNSISGIDSLVFTDTAGLIAGIQNGNLLDKSATEVISGNYTFSNDVVLTTGVIKSPTGTYNYLDLDVSGDALWASRSNIICRIDSDNGQTDRGFYVQRDTGSTMMKLGEDGDLWIYEGKVIIDQDNEGIQFGETPGDAEILFASATQTLDFEFGGGVEMSLDDGGLDVVSQARAQQIKLDGDGSGTASTNTITGVTDTPTTDPGWASSSTVDMNAPDGYIKAYVGTQAVVVPYWNT